MWLNRLVRFVCFVSCVVFCVSLLAHSYNSLTDDSDVPGCQRAVLGTGATNEDLAEFQSWCQETVWGQPQPGFFRRVLLNTIYASDVKKCSAIRRCDQQFSWGALTFLALGAATILVLAIRRLERPAPPPPAARREESDSDDVPAIRARRPRRPPRYFNHRPRGRDRRPRGGCTCPSCNRGVKCVVCQRCIHCFACTKCSRCCSCTATTSATQDSSNRSASLPSSLNSTPDTSPDPSPAPSPASTPPSSSSREPSPQVSLTSHPTPFLSVDSIRRQRSLRVENRRRRPRAQPPRPVSRSAGHIQV